MSAIHYNADEILEMAEQIERNGANFYARTAENTDDPEAKKLLLELSVWEQDHEKTFAEMREELRGQPDEADVDDLAGSYLRAIADGHVFDIQTDPAELLSGNESLEEILNMAIDQEKNSIIFYLGMQVEMPDLLGTGRVEKIIREEMGHIAMLSNKLSELAG